MRNLIFRYFCWLRPTTKRLSRKLKRDFFGFGSHRSDPIRCVGDGRDSKRRRSFASQRRAPLATTAPPFFAAITFSFSLVSISHTHTLSLSLALSLSLTLSHTHTCTHARTHTPTHTHTYMHTHMHAHVVYLPFPYFIVGQIPQTISLSVFHSFTQHHPVGTLVCLPMSLFMPLFLVMQCSSSASF